MGSRIHNGLISATIVWPHLAPLYIKSVLQVLLVDLWELWLPCNSRSLARFKSTCALDHLPKGHGFSPAPFLSHLSKGLGPLCALNIAVDCPELGLTFRPLCALIGSLHKDFRRLCALADLLPQGFGPLCAPMGRLPEGLRLFLFLQIWMQIFMFLSIGVRSILTLMLVC